ncbi:MAG TPA: hypothetical protein VEW47_08065 [Candidatus Dormibacteraeota bacterium]|nr:hypothetical protein [Candidatus Dormibacteraeota bacterium]
MARLGKDFAIRQFHNVALTNDVLPSVSWSESWTTGSPPGLRHPPRI